jgi:hypothetical protein
MFAYDFNVNRQFATKTDRNFIFLDRDLHILYRLYIMVPYMGFYWFSKFSLKIHAYGFTENRQFAAKTDQNSEFLGRDPNIPNRLYIMVSYMSFYEFSKFSNFRLKFISVSLRFYRKSPVCGKKLTETP